MNRAQQQGLLTMRTQGKAAGVSPAQAGPAQHRQALGQMGSDTLRVSSPSLAETPTHGCCQWWLCELSVSMLPVIQTPECTGQIKHSMQKNQPISTSAAGVETMRPTPYTRTSVGRGL